MSQNEHPGFLCPWTSSREKKMKFLIGNLQNKPAPERKIYTLSYSCLDNSKERNELFIPKLHSANVYMMEQTYTRWKVLWETNDVRNQCRCIFPMKSIIYLQPLGEFPDFVSRYTFSFGKNEMDLFTILREFARIFFLGLEVNIRLPLMVDFERSGIKSRVHSVTGQKQYLSPNFFPLLRKVLPKDGFCIMGITWTDLYPAVALNFNLGESSFRHGSGVFCFGRFEPLLYQTGHPIYDITRVDECLIWKLLKVTVHEICHLFGLMHCEVFSCGMNDSASMEEAMSQPIFLCPICLRKLQKACNFNLRMRYTKLHQFFTVLQESLPYYRFRDAECWLTKCLEFLTDPERIPPQL